MHSGLSGKSVCPGTVSGDTVAAGKVVMCIRLTPSVQVKSDTGFFAQGDFNWHTTYNTQKSIF